MIFKGDVYYANLNLMIRIEQDGVRPVVVLQNDIVNKYNPTTIIAPMTTQRKNYVPMNVKLKESFLARYATLLLFYLIPISMVILKIMSKFNCLTLLCSQNCI